jgi:hypothetical protein
MRHELDVTNRQKAAGVRSVAALPDDRFEAVEVGAEVDALRPHNGVLVRCDGGGARHCRAGPGELSAGEFLCLIRFSLSCFDSQQRCLISLST